MTTRNSQAANNSKRSNKRVRLTDSNDLGTTSGEESSASLLKGASSVETLTKAAQYINDKTDNKMAAKKSSNKRQKVDKNSDNDVESKYEAALRRIVELEGDETQAPTTAAAAAPRSETPDDVLAQDLLALRKQGPGKVSASSKTRRVSEEKKSLNKAAAAAAAATCANKAICTATNTVEDRSSSPINQLAQNEQSILAFARLIF